jgi:hypothetical protein
LAAAVAATRIARHLSQCDVATVHESMPIADEQKLALTPVLIID